MKSFLLTRFLPVLALLVTFGEPVLAQPGSGGPAPTSPTAVPVDGGLSPLLAGRVAFGIRHLRNRRKRA